MQASTGSDVILCILNGKAGTVKALDTERRLCELFARHGAQAKILVAQDGDDISALVRQETQHGCALIVAGGGDGTVNAVASVLAGTDIVLGVLPLGTLNHFAKDLLLPLELEGAVDNLFTGRTVQVDVGEVNGKLFLNNSSLGIYPVIVRQREKLQEHGRGKWSAFVQAVVYALWRYSALHISVRVNGQDKTEEKTPFIFVGNNRYEISGLSIGKRAHLNGGRLWVYRAPRASRAGLFLMALRSVMGWQSQRELKIFDADAFEVHTRKAYPHLATDGEVVRLKTPLRYRIHRRALRVIVPASAEPAA